MTKRRITRGYYRTVELCCIVWDHKGAVFNNITIFERLLETRLISYSISVNGVFAFMPLIGIRLFTHDAQKLGASKMVRDM